MNADDVEALARSAADWLANPDTWEPADPTLYHGISGVALGLHEAHMHFGDDLFGDAVEHGLDLISAQVDQIENASLYFGLAGMAMCLQRLGRDDAAEHALS